MNFGQSKKYEDLCPLDEVSALVVCGKSYVDLNKLLTVRYRREAKGTIKLSGINTIFTANDYLRLGNIFENELYYSKGYSVYKIKVENVNKLRPEKICMGIQPFAFKDGIVYQNKGSIYLDGKRILTPLNEYKIIGRPTVNGDIMYYEARSGEAPQSWEVWKYNLITEENKKILKGANPYVLKNILHYSLWDDGKSEFVLRWEYL